METLQGISFRLSTPKNVQADRRRPWEGVIDGRPVLRKYGGTPRDIWPFHKGRQDILSLWHLNGIRKVEGPRITSVLLDWRWACARSRGGSVDPCRLSGQGRHPTSSTF